MKLTKDLLSQSEIDSLLEGTNDENNKNVNENIISNMEKDTIGEIGNISMGTAATTLSTLLNKKVIITTPRVEVTNYEELSYEYPIPFVAVDVTYKEGLEGSNILMVKTDDVKIITDIMMGEEEIDLERELTELDLSAISEVMNQMMGSAATSLSEVFMKKIDIDPPKSYEITVSEGRETLSVLKSDNPIIKVSFKMVVEDLIDSELMQLVPLNFGKALVKELLGESQDVIQEPEELSMTISMDTQDNNERVEEFLQTKSMEESVTTRKREEIVEKEPVVVKKPEFETFDTSQNLSYNESIELVGDIPVEITVELGRTTKKIGEILEYGPGTVLELDKLVGEPLNLYANGKFIAKGEVVVIDDNFGVRITDINNTYGK
ncbi:MAG: flagellar motor switch phosphatase FliY [Tissierellia bacterium]|nr:flagellar motor switch phosphatase FliY [Tissierellia bacterium]